MATMSELFEVLADLPRVDQPIRWPDPPDIDAEYVCALLMASSGTSERIKATVEVLLEHCSTLHELVDELDDVAIRFGKDGDGETCAALLDLGGVIRDWSDR
jgi:hypothetical protein